MRTLHLFAAASHLLSAALLARYSSSHLPEFTPSPGWPTAGTVRVDLRSPNTTNHLQFIREAVNHRVTIVKELRSLDVIDTNPPLPEAHSN